MKKALCVVAVLLFCVAALANTTHTATKMTVQNTITNLAPSTSVHVLRADGSDPMPTCQPWPACIPPSVPHPQCPPAGCYGGGGHKLIEQTAQAPLLNERLLLSDGTDPMPLCRPGHPGCQPMKLTIADGGPLPLCPPSKKCCSLTPHCTGGGTAQQ